MKASIRYYLTVKRRRFYRFLCTPLVPELLFFDSSRKSRSSSHTELLKFHQYHADRRVSPQHERSTMSQAQNRKILITSALPYANGPIHLGHLVEAVQTDIWARFQRLRGHACYYVCANDAHGTPIMLNAQSLNITPEQLIEQVHASHIQDYQDFLVHFDCFHSTHSEENRGLTESIYLALKSAGHIDKRTINQLFDPEKAMFLPDRFVKGTCPKCQAPDQYGDNCEVCGATYGADELINPRSTVSGATPVIKESEHFFFKVQDFEDDLKTWLRSGNHVQEQVANKMDEWFEAGLQSWDISRDKPYFGYPIPGEKDKYFYVWLDAPIGYMASFKKLCDENPDINFDEYWQADSDAELYHFIGKDIIYFHTLFWPATLRGSGYRLPTGVFAHGFLTVNGEKMSKSRGTFIKARTYLEHLDPEYLRYFFAAKLTPRIDDFDLNLEDFAQRVNTDLVNKYVNLASRCGKFASKFDFKLADECGEEDLAHKFQAAGDEIAQYYEQRDFSKAMRLILSLVDDANVYIDQKAPWKLKDDIAAVQEICSVGINLFRLVTIYLKPVLPHLAAAIEQWLLVDALKWEDKDHLLLGHQIGEFKPLLKRVDNKAIAAIIEASKENTAQVKSDTTEGSAKKEEGTLDLKPEITFDDFDKVDLRVARIVKAEHVKKAKKLLRLELDLGSETRQVFAGIKQAYEPEKLEGKLTVMVANLAPRKMPFGVSEGMVLAAGPGGEDLWILNPDEGAQPGMRVK